MRELHCTATQQEKILVREGEGSSHDNKKLLTVQNCHGSLWSRELIFTDSYKRMLFWSSNIPMLRKQKLQNILKIIQKIDKEKCENVIIMKTTL